MRKYISFKIFTGSRYLVTSFLRFWPIYLWSFVYNCLWEFFRVSRLMIEMIIKNVSLIVNLFLYCWFTYRFQIDRFLFILSLSFLWFALDQLTLFLRYDQPWNNTADLSWSLLFVEYIITPLNLLDWDFLLSTFNWPLRYLIPEKTVFSYCATACQFDLNLQSICLMNFINH